MMLYVYCLVTAAHEPPGPELRGLGGAPVRMVSASGAGAWVSDFPTGLGAVSPEFARAHDAVVRAAMASETPLPARFGQVIADEVALRRTLDERQHAILEGLERVRGSVEMTVRVLLDGAPSERADRPTTGSGRGYMEWLRDRQCAERDARHRAENLQTRVGRAVGEVVRAEARSRGAEGAGTAAVSHLVARGDVRRYRLLVRALADREPELRLLVSGPWAPYSFSELSGG